jgi:hypothetical protein
MASTHYTTPLDPRVATLVDTLTANEREAFEEKAGIRQHLGLFTQAQAEIEALLDVLSSREPAGTPLHVFRLTRPGDASRWVVSCDLNPLLACLHGLDGIDIAEASLSEVIEQQFGGLAFLATTA